MYKVIQSSPTHTGSTLLLNLVHGFLSPKEEIHYDTEQLIHKFLITKTHNINVDKLESKYKEYKLYFVMSERNDNKVHSLVNNKYKKYNNVLVINYNEINESNELTLDNIIENIFNKFIIFFPDDLIPRKKDFYIKEDMKNRIINMNKLYEEIKDKPFSYLDKFYGIHGSHRNRIGK